ncbi:MAG TPA: SAM-dependent methyltransferase [Kofleriaceae bacterium]|nr:SAM-dependent methyltransferase [Kofleriaceae bacterium]
MRKKVDRRETAEELLPGAAPEVAIELMKDLHLLTRDGDLNADARRKLKQIRHLLQLLAPALDDVHARHGEPVVVDCGAGKSYLGFLMYATRMARESKGRLVAIEARPELVEAARERARRFGCERMELVGGDIATAPLPPRVHLVTALHACDTATDDAIARGVAAGADWIAVVPCCQAEVARQLAGGGPTEPALAALCAHPWHRRELGSHLTNVVRALALEANGYQVTVTELTGWEHSLKNELILARRVKRFDRDAQARLDELVTRFGIEPSLVRSLAAQAGTAG